MQDESEPTKKIGHVPDSERRAAESGDRIVSNAESEQFYPKLEADGSEREAQLLEQGLTEQEIAKQAAKDDYDRGRRFKDHFEQIAICGMWIGALALLVVGLSWLWHLLMPGRWRWLADTDMDKLQNIFAGGILISAFADHFRKRVN